jgi:hypothetical protein
MRCEPLLKHCMTRKTNRSNDTPPSGKLGKINFMRDIKIRRHAIKYLNFNSL